MDAVIKNGFRRVQTDSGISGYVPARAVHAGGAAAGDAAGAGGAGARSDAGPPSAAALHRRFEELLSATASDPDVGNRARSLLDRRRGAEISAWAAVVLGAGLLLANSYTERPRLNITRAGYAILALGPPMSWLSTPSEGDLRDVVAAWNERHPGTVLALARRRSP